MVDKGTWALQRVAKQLYPSKAMESGCYFLCLSGDTDPKLASEHCSEAIKHGWMKDDGYVLQPQKIIGAWRGFTPTLYAARGSWDDLINPKWKLRIAHFVNGSASHFVVVNKFGAVIYDPMGWSVTTSRGSIKDFRLFG